MNRFILHAHIYNHLLIKYLHPKGYVAETEMIYLNLQCYKINNHHRPIFLTFIQAEVMKIEWGRFLLYICITVIAEFVLQRILESSFSLLYCYFGLYCSL